jgi:hypothetical protein
VSESCGAVSMFHLAAEFSEITANGFATLQPAECRYAVRIQGTAAHRSVADVEHAVIVSGDDKLQDQAFVIGSLRNVDMFADMFEAVGRV